MMITAMEPEHYGVQITEGDLTTSHRVVVPETVLDELAMTDVDPGRVVEETIDFPLDRQPASNLADEASVADFHQRDPVFDEVLRTRVATRHAAPRTLG